MTLHQYSVLLSIGVFAVLGLALVSMLAYAFSPKARRWLNSVDYYAYIKGIGLLSVIATAGALIYQFVYLTPVCAYCWWQRIFMFPIDFIAIGTVMYKLKHNEKIIGWLAAVGAFFAGYHYYYHYQVIVKNNPLALPCSSIGIVPSCTDSPVLVAQFITIPLMAFIVFVAIVWITFLARRAH